MRRDYAGRDVCCMNALMLALFRDHQAAETVRVALFRDGFPTDRLSVTSQVDEGPAGVEPDETQHHRLLTYFQSLFSLPGEQELAEQLTAQVEQGAAALTIHPRGDIETVRATELVRRANPVIFETRDLDSQAFERAASSSNQAMAGKVVKAITGLDAKSVGLSRRP